MRFGDGCRVDDVDRGSTEEWVSGCTPLTALSVIVEWVVARHRTTSRQSRSPNGPPTSYYDADRLLTGLGFPVAGFPVGVAVTLSLVMFTCTTTAAGTVTASPHDNRAHLS